MGKGTGSGDLVGRGVGGMSGWRIGLLGLLVVLLVMPGAGAGEIDSGRRESQVVSLEEGGDDENWTVQFGPSVPDGMAVNESESRTVFEFGVMMRLQPSVGSSANIQLFLEVEDSEVVCWFNVERGSGQGQEWFTHRKNCVVPLMNGTHVLNVRTGSSANIALRSWDVVVTQHVALEGKGNVSLNISEVDVKTTALLDFAWVAWAVYTALTFAVRDRAARGVMAAVGMLLALLPIDGTAKGVLVLAQAGILLYVVLLGIREAEGRQERGRRRSA